MLSNHGIRRRLYIDISFIAVYVYYVLTTLDEEVAVMVSQRWSRGRIIFTFIRCGPCLSMTLHLISG
ncbi:hypothetical protein FA13DRAFT_1280792 [Coprinellus micaceus]|uniref:DUF6533 domain-containing protein n=1 Tax=Coprinellus micaceus TaxID=71717 RepID=A0A4Y7SSX0_COPMI|nr:hypothetical protein FA13DRAFT_1280792 [Coprinellus micaceus]